MCTPTHKLLLLVGLGLHVVQAQPGCALTITSARVRFDNNHALHACVPQPLNCDLPRLVHQTPACVDNCSCRLALEAPTCLLYFQSAKAWQQIGRCLQAAHPAAYARAWATELPPGALPLNVHLPAARQRAPRPAGPGVRISAGCHAGPDSPLCVTHHALCMAVFAGGRAVWREVHGAAGGGHIGHGGRHCQRQVRIRVG